MKKILFYILIFTTITGGLFGVFGGVNDEKNKGSILGVEEVFACTTSEEDYCNSLEGRENISRCMAQCTTDEVDDDQNNDGISNNDNSSSEGSTLDSYGVTCSLMSGFNPGACFTSFSYYIGYIPSSIVLQGSAKIFNKMLAFSMSKSVIEQDFVKTTWNATRGFANMLFILILVVISISIILDYGKFGSTKLIANVIIVALIVNFSLFAARVVIDAGNIVALGFYDSITAEPIQDNIGQINTDVQQKDISGALVRSFNPTQLLSPASFKKWRETSPNKTGANAMLAIIFLVGAGINFYTAYIFFMAGFIFVVRVVYLWMLMAIAPLAFISFAIPTFKHYWTEWWDELFKKSFVIVVFMFMIWLILMIIGGDFLKGAFGDLSNTESFGIIDFLVIVFMQYMIVITLLKMTLEKTKAMSKDHGIGNKIFGMAKGAVGLAGFATGGALVGAALKGGVGLAARKGIGGAGSWASNKIEQRQKEGKSTGFASRLVLKGTKKLESKKFGTKEGYKDQTERVAKEEKALVRKFKDITLKDGTIKKKEDLEKEYYDRQQSKVKRNLTRVAGAAAIVATGGLATPLAIVMGDRRGGENKAFLDYKEKRNVLKEINRMKEELKNAKQDLIKTKNKANLLKNNPSAQNVVNVKKTKLEEEIKEKNEEIKKKKEKIKNLS